MSAFMPSSVAKVRLWWRGRSRLARVFLVFLGLAAVLWAAHQALLWNAPAEVTQSAVSGWMRLFLLLSAVLGSILLVRWTRRRLLWRLRNRLIVTYVFIGVIPVVLLLFMGLLAGYLFAGQFATYVASGEIRSELKAVEGANTTVAAEVADQIRRERPVGRRRIEPPPGVKLPGAGFAEREITAWFRGEAAVLQSPAGGEGRVLSRPAWMGDQFRGVVFEGGQLYLRAAVSIPVGGEALTVISSVPVDEVLLNRVAAGLGEVLVVPADLRLTEAPASPQETGRVPEGAAPTPQRETNITIGTRPVFEVDGQGQRARTVTAGDIPAELWTWDPQVTFGTLFSVVDWRTGETANSLIRVRTRPSMLYHQLFITVGEAGRLMAVALLVVAVFFAVIELIALFVGVGLTRTITRSVANLYEATERVNQGDLSHRIEVKNSDQLAALEGSFNSMMASLERLLAEQKEKERLQSELAIAQEVQAQLFPQQVDQLSTLEVEGFCRPARIVSGDYYDFIRLGSDELVVAVGDVSGKGISAALMMATLHSAVRAYEFGRVNEITRLAPVGADVRNLDAARSGLQNPARVLELLNRHLYLSTPPEKYATLFLGLYDGRERRLTYSNAGHLAPLLIGSDGAVRRLDAGGLVTGLFPDITYEEQTLKMHPGDLLVAYSDGVTEPENEFGEFGEERLLETVLEHRHLPLSRILEQTVAAVQDWIGAEEQPDDLTLVLARAR
jgi:sigma-B regulation protein RsbU (phosphoserine phosphatase)